ncbi:MULTISPECIES: molybdate ABC transporter permease subunit [Exiguobacterium]|uniref:molybdate ABC transporter permease subunit n=1 Tax=Exiguobacterium TaxID=33986 RepID=UPI001BEAD216|nr:MULTISPECIES: ABC transporter permease subunit [Exiguobacterium]MCT4783241.1 ABC transporter permease subunit [Exiguobacterium himgiriensis]
MMLSPIQLTFEVGLIATGNAFVVAFAAAYFMHHRQFKGKRLVDTLFLLPLILPPTVIGLYALIALGNNGLGSFLPVNLLFTKQANVIASALAAFPLIYQTIRLGLNQLDAEWYEAGRVLGGTERQLFTYVTIPLLLPALTSGFVLGFARSIGEFGITMMIAGNIPGETMTLATAIYMATLNGNMTQALIWSGWLIGLAFLVLWLSERYGKRRD